MGFVREANVPLLAACILGLIKELLYQKILSLIDFSAKDAVDELFVTVLAMVKK